MNARTWYLVTAILLTALDLAVVVFQGCRFGRQGQVTFGIEGFLSYWRR